MKEIILKKYKINQKHFRVAIFGSARIKKNDKNYKLIHNLAKIIGEEGIDIVTGGGPGIMEAANSGHKSGSRKNMAHSFGLLIKIPKEQKANKHLDIKKEFKRFSNRLDKFVALSNVVVVAPGGIGTTLELFYVWQLVQVTQICDIPIILLGEQWKELIKWMINWLLRNKYIDKKDLDFVFPVKTAKEAMKIIDKSHDMYKKGGKNICTNLKKYGFK